MFHFFSPETELKADVGWPENYAYVLKADYIHLMRKYEALVQNFMETQTLVSDLQKQRNVAMTALEEAALQKMPK